MEFLLRLLISIALFLVPFVLFLLMSKQLNKELILLYPFLGLIPGAVSALVIFLPIEYLLRVNGLELWSTPAVVVAGSMMVLLTIALVGGSNKRRGLKLIREGKVKVSPDAPILQRKRPSHSITGLASWILIGAFWGAMWRLSDWAVDMAGLFNA